tara:strand:+ start:994 stop:2004 length:1011 start_codon:yes stop_codon:yes gene_type:complete
MDFIENNFPLIVTIFFIQLFVTFIIVKYVKNQDTEDTDLTTEINNIHTELGTLKTDLKADLTTSVTTGIMPLQSVVNNLNSVFYSDRKTGAWGERRLDYLIQDSGYRLGEDYETQYKIEGGRPDFVKFNAYGNKTLIIDSKLSTENFMNLVNAQSINTEGENPEAREARINKFHDQLGFNIIDRIQECAKYNDDKNTLGITLMYIDIESLFVYIMKEKFKKTKSASKVTLLYQLAEQNNVLIVSPTTLSLVLGHINIVKEKFKIAEEHQDLEEKLGDFIRAWEAWSETISSVEDDIQKIQNLLGSEKGVLKDLKLYQVDRRNKLDKIVDAIKNLLS